MSTKKVSVTLDRDLLAEARYRTGGRGMLSAYINDALRGKILSERQAEYLESLDVEFGPIPVEIVRAVDLLWNDIQRSF